MEILGIDVSPYINELLGIIVTGIVAWVGKVIKDHVHLKNKEKYADIAATFIEQAFKDLDGIDKFDEGMRWLEEQLTSKHIKFDAEEMGAMLESAVHKMNKGIMDSVKK